MVQVDMPDDITLSHFDPFAGDLFPRTKLVFKDVHSERLHVDVVSSPLDLGVSDRWIGTNSASGEMSHNPTPPHGVFENYNHPVSNELSTHVLTQRLKRLMQPHS